MHATRLLVLYFIPTKYYQNISKDINVMDRISMRLRMSASGEITTYEESASCLFYTQHLFWSSSSSLRNIIKLSQTLWPAQIFGFRRDIYITKIVSCLSCTRHSYWSCHLFLPDIQNMAKGIKIVGRTRMRRRTDRRTDAMLIAISPNQGIKMRTELLSLIVFNLSSLQLVS